LNRIATRYPFLFLSHLIRFKSPVPSNGKKSSSSFCFRYHPRNALLAVLFIVQWAHHVQRATGPFGSSHIQFGTANQFADREFRPSLATDRLSFRRPQLVRC